MATFMMELNSLSNVEKSTHYWADVVGRKRCDQNFQSSCENCPIHSVTSRYAVTTRDALIQPWIDVNQAIKPAEIPRAKALMGRPSLVNQIFCRNKNKYVANTINSVTTVA